MDRVVQTVADLQAAGIRADRGYPGRRIQVLEAPIATVTVERSDQKEIALAVTVYSLPDQGGKVCEELAQSAAEVLRAKRARCSVGPCGYDAQCGLLAQKVRAVWKNSLVSPVRVDNNQLVYATDFSAVQTRQVEQVVDAETGKVSVVNEEVIWTVAIQELLPFREAMEVDHKEAFTLTVIHENCTEIYPGCYWLSITLEEGDGGLIRKRIARSWTERIVEIPEA